MNKLILICLLFAVGCGRYEPDPPLVIFLSDPYVWGAEGYYIEVIDDCEYIAYKRTGHIESLAHKGNCKYCLNRNK